MFSIICPKMLSTLVVCFYDNMLIRTILCLTKQLVHIAIQGNGALIYVCLNDEKCKNQYVLFSLFQQVICRHNSMENLKLKIKGSDAFSRLGGIA